MARPAPSLCLLPPYERVELPEGLAASTSLGAAAALPNALAVLPLPSAHPLSLSLARPSQIGLGCATCEGEEAARRAAEAAKAWPSKESGGNPIIMVGEPWWQ